MCSRNLPHDADPRTSFGSDVLHARISDCFDSLVLWAGLAILRVGLNSAIKNFPFNIGWWGFTFPLGVFASSTVQMGTELPSRFFNVIGTVSYAILLFAARKSF
jgi:tellurite resistance protein TehA-like permease